MDKNAKLIAYLTQYITTERLCRINQVSAERTNHIAVIVENLYQSHNMSAVLRTSECLGVQNVYMIENNFEYQINKEVSMGSDKWLTIHRFNKQGNNTAACLEAVKAAGYQIVATMPSEKECQLEDLDISHPTAFLFGTELTGLSSLAIDSADRFVKIPMYGFTESYNISVSVAIVLSNVIEKIRKTNIPWQLTPNELEVLRLDWIKKAIKDIDGILKRHEEMSL